MRGLFVITVVCALLAPGMAGAAEVSSGLSVVVPPDKAVVESESISMVLRLGGETADQVQISVNNRKLPPIKAPFYQNYAFKDGIPLSYGLNRIKVARFEGGKKVEEVNLAVFCKSDFSPDSTAIPPGFKPYAFHVGSFEKKCALCHQLDFKNIDATAGAGDQSPCYTCHKKKLANYALIHGPAAVWSCLTCHDVKSKNPKMAVRKPVGKICAECHENTWQSLKFQHGPTAAGDCTACHDPHASNQANFLRASAGDLCVLCHEDILSKPHVISGILGNGGHPLRRAPDPYHPGREFNCASCHNPHGENSQFLLKDYDSSMPMDRFCKNCHFR